MTRIERKLLIQNAVLGICLTLLVIALDWRGDDSALAPMERWLNDLRARQCQLSAPPPSRKLVHIDIDNQALQTIGAWPWRRTVLAEMTRELDQAGAKIIAYDVLFSEPQEVDYIPIKTAGSAESSKPGQFKRVDEDANFSDAIQEAANVILPAQFHAELPLDPDQQFVFDILVNEKLVTLATDIASAFENDNRKVPPLLEIDAMRTDLRPRVMYRLINTGLDDIDPAKTNLAHYPTVEQIRQLIWPDGTWPVQRAFPSELLRQEYIRAVAFHRMGRFARPVSSVKSESNPDARVVAITPMKPALAPLPQLLEHAAATAYVDYLVGPDGVTRSVALLQREGDRLYPQFGLMIACAYLGVSFDDVEFHANEIVIPTKPEPIHIPVFEHHVNAVDQNCGMYMQLNWFGGDQWLNMYDGGDVTRPSQHLSIVAVWSLIQVRRAREKELLSENFPELLQVFNRYFDPESFDRLEKTPLPKNIEARSAELKPLSAKLNQASVDMDKLDLVSDAKFTVYLKSLSSDQERKYYTEAREILRIIRRIVRIETRFQEEQHRLKTHVKNKAVLVGWTATGHFDELTTSIHSSCPGAVGHGVIFNNIVSNDMLTRVSSWYTRLATLAIGLLATWVAASLNPVRALLSSFLIVVGYTAFNGFYIFDQHNYVLGLAAPAFSVILIWSLCTLARFAVERSERARITKRFRSYVDPALVDYVIDHPEQARLSGHVCELTVVFTDLKNFTALSERLQERTVPILNEFMGRMVKIIRDENKPVHKRGYVNKFLGDGIMFFFGAPYDNESHAADAVATVIRMQTAMVDFNQYLTDQDLPNVQMRVGVSTGSMVVGDAGSEDASDYTVLGDTVNFGSRLEGANRETGTLILISERTQDLIDDAMLCRPIGKLQVVGKTVGVMVYEPLSFSTDATDQQNQLAAMSESMVTLFAQRQFSDCIIKCGELESEFGESKITALYRNLCQQYMNQPPDTDFDGTIVLTSK